MPLLEVNNLSVKFQMVDGHVTAVNDISFSLERGQTLGIVGESGSGKSQTVLAMMGLLANNGQATGSVKFEEQELLGMPLKTLNKIRGNRVAMIFQDPMTSLNPYLSVERQLTEVLEFHQGMSRQAARAGALRALDAVKIPDAARRMGMYPHEFSGGMRQRVMIAMALLCRPDVLVADEPTTALDVTVQAQIISLLRELQRDNGTAIVMITHDLGVVAGLCDKVIVLYGGRVMEQGTADSIFYQPSHPYTIGLLAAIPRPDLTDRPLVAIPGVPPNMAHLPPGCPFSERCPLAVAQCADVRPRLLPLTEASSTLRACHKTPAEVAAFVQAQRHEIAA